MKLTVGISVYDKIEELQILISILEKISFVKEIYVATTCEREEVITQLKKLPITKLVKINIPLVKVDKVKFHFSLTARIVESQRSLVKLWLKEGDSKFYIHTHSDGWILSAYKLLQLLKAIEAKNITFAFRGTGLGYRYIPGAPLGELDDHFYVFKRADNLLNLPMMKIDFRFFPLHILNIHGFWAAFAVLNIGLNKLWHYSNGLKWKAWDGKVLDNTYGMPLKPFVWDEDWALLHIHRESFPEDWGRSLQAYFLANFLEKSLISPTVEAFIDKYFDKRIIEKISDQERKLTRRLKFFLLSPKLFHRDLNVMQKVYNKIRKGDVKTLIYYHIKQTMPYIEKLLKPRRYFLKDFYSEYPKNFKDYLESLLQIIEKNLEGNRDAIK